LQGSVYPSNNLDNREMSRRYVDNALNRRLGRVGLAIGSLVRECPQYTIRNPATNRCVSVEGIIGKKLYLQNPPKAPALSPKRGRSLLVCHGADYDPVEGYENADTLDIAKQAKPTILMDISSDAVPKRYQSKYDQIIMVYCLMTAFLNVEDYDTFGKKKQQLEAVRKTFENLHQLLRKNGTVVINNFGLYLENIKNPKRLNLQGKLDKFSSPIADLFEVQELVLPITKNEGYQLILRKR
jgi:hypothetical protein